jgi:NADPH-dependent 2,4-dienoyl-CoA reductase/sulfur reductase-like enzyme/nitrite reductase/ring-hydroxylating ferredoxin subunit
MSKPKQLSGPDFTQGYSFAKLRDGEMLLGHAEGEHVLLARRGDEVFAVGAACTHYGALLTDGILVDDTVHCPWHHACFSLRTGEALAAPAFKPLPCWQVEREGDNVRLAARKPAPQPRPAPAQAPDSVVVIGAGAAGTAAVDMLRREGYRGAITMIGAEANPPVDRPNLSKEYLAGSMPEDWLWLMPEAYYRDNDIELITGVAATAIDTSQHQVKLADGRALSYGALLLATGAEPVHLTIPGADLSHVHYLRSLPDSRAIIVATANAKCAVVIGASFIGLEAAASLRARGLEVHVVAPGARPLERILGAEIGDFIRALHEQTHGVIFHLDTKPIAITAEAVTLESGERISADLVVVGVGVRPAVNLAQQAGLAVDNGVLVDAYLETSVPGIYAAGDIARYLDSRSGERVRIEHWVVAQRQGQTAARNMLGRRERYTAVPFFWSAHYDVTLNYVGHAEHWDRIEIDGSIQDHDCTLRYLADGRVRAVLTIFRDRESLRAAVDMGEVAGRVA